MRKTSVTIFVFRWWFWIAVILSIVILAAFGLFLWITEPAPWAVIISWVLSLICPAASVAGAIAYRGNRKAFFAGMAVTQVSFATFSVGMTESICWLLTGGSDVDNPLALSPSSVFFDGVEFARGTIGILIVSVISGFLAMLVCAPVNRNAGTGRQ